MTSFWTECIKSLLKIRCLGGGGKTLKAEYLLQYLLPMSSPIKNIYIYLEGSDIIFKAQEAIAKISLHAFLPSWTVEVLDRSFSEINKRIHTAAKPTPLVTLYSIHILVMFCYSTVMASELA